MAQTAAPPDASIAKRQLNKVSRIPGVQLDIKLGREVIIRIPGVDQSYRGTFVGIDPYEFIIAKVRIPSAIRHNLALGGEIIAKYMYKGTLYGFKAQVHNAITSPASLIFFEYPDMIEKLPLRQTARLKCNIDGMLYSKDDAAECMVVNVSETGCKISTRAGSKNPLSATRLDDALVLAMNLGGKGELKVTVSVKNISTEKGVLHFGCTFLDITKEEMALINGYLDKIVRLAS